VNKPPAFQFYPKDWLASGTVRRMSWAARGLFIELLALCWDNEGLPTESEDLRRMVRCQPGVWRRLWAEVKPAFVEQRGKLVNRKLSKLRTEMRKLSESRSAAARQRNLTGYVYAAIKRESKAVKIGLTTNIRARMTGLSRDVPPTEPQTRDGFPNWEKVELLAFREADSALEREAHTALASELIGGEWFRASEKTLAWVKQKLGNGSTKP
jgi:hypothetical protein